MTDPITERLDEIERHEPGPSDENASHQRQLIAALRGVVDYIEDVDPDDWQEAAQALIGRIASALDVTL